MSGNTLLRKFTTARAPWRPAFGAVLTVSSVFAFSLGLTGCHKTENAVPAGAQESVRTDAPQGTNPTDTPSPAAEPAPTGRWLPSPSHDTASTDQAADDEMLQQVLAVGYLQGSRAATSQIGVTVNDTGRTFNSLNLVMSGHEPCAEIMDMEGNVLHTWRRSYQEIWPDRPAAPEWVEYQFWRRVHLYPDGSILVVFDGYGIAKLDAASNVIWSRPERYHHHFAVDEDGTIYTLDRRDTQRPDLTPHPVIWDDFVVRLTPSGEIIDSVSILECIQNSPYAALLRRIDKTLPDVLHTNAVEICDGSNAATLPMFTQGRVLVSISMLDTVALIDLVEKRVVWALTGLWSFQHQPIMLKNGNLLVFDNRGRPRASSVIEISPLTQEIVWKYEGTAEEPFFTNTCGSNQRLPNGNTLITESDAGRAFEVTPDKTIVWEYENPHRAGKENELVATLFEIVRLPVDFPTAWMKKP